MKVGIPLFIYPNIDPNTQQGRDWARVVAVAAKILAVTNPASGPGSATNTDYVRAIKALRSAGAEVAGYVATKYATRADAANNIDLWNTLYGINYIFLDEASGDPKDLEYYAKLNVQTSGKVITNQGASPQTSRYLKCADIICNFESTFDNYMARQFAPWELAAKDRMFHIVLGCPQNQLSAALNRARMSCGYVFITHQTDTPPDYRAYKILPDYFEQLVARTSV